MDTSSPPIAFRIVMDSLSLNPFILPEEDRCRMLHYIRLLNLQPENDTSIDCPDYYDEYVCWSQTAPNTTVSRACPNISESSVGKKLTKYCSPLGEWLPRETDISLCSPLQIPEVEENVHMLIMYYIYWVGYCISTLILLCSLIHYCSKRNLWCVRNFIHANLVLCFGLHNIVWITYSAITYEFEVSLTGNYALSLCLISSALFKFFLTAGFFWMFLEGFYLLISIMFVSYKHSVNQYACSFIGWVPALSLILTRIFIQKWDLSTCWEETDDNLEYIIIGPILCILVTNIVMLFFVMSAVISKLRTVHHGEWRLYIKSLRAFLILCPLLGINYILIIIVHPSKPRWLSLGLAYFTSIVTSTQGGLVAVLFYVTNAKSRLRGTQSKNSCSHPPNPSVALEHARTRSISRNRDVPTAKKTVYRNVIMMDSSGRLRCAKLGNKSPAPSPLLPPKERSRELFPRPHENNDLLAADLTVLENQKRHERIRFSLSNPTGSFETVL